MYDSQGWRIGHAVETVTSLQVNLKLMESLQALGAAVRELHGTRPLLSSTRPAAQLGDWRTACARHCGDALPLARRISRARWFVAADPWRRAFRI